MSRTEPPNTARSAADGDEPPHPVEDVTLAAGACINPSPLARSVSSATAAAAALASSLLESSAAALADAVRSTLQQSPTPPTEAAVTDSGASGAAQALPPAAPLPLFASDSPQLLPADGAGDTGAKELEEQLSLNASDDASATGGQLETRFASGSAAAAAAVAPSSGRVDYLAAARAAHVRVVVVSDGFESGDDLQGTGGGGGGGGGCVGEPLFSAAAAARRWRDDRGVSDAGWSSTITTAAAAAAAATSTLAAGRSGGSGCSGATDEAAGALLELEDAVRGGGAQRNLTAAQRARLFHRIFRSVPEDEPLVKDHICAFQREMILQQGKMYLTPHHICFFANILGYQTKYFFTSFISREAAFANLQLLLSRHRHGIGGAPPFPFLSSAASSRQNSDSSFADTADTADAATDTATGPKPLGTGRHSRTGATIATRVHRSSLPPPATGTACGIGGGGTNSWGLARSPSPPASSASPKYVRHSLVGASWTAADRRVPVGHPLPRQSSAIAAASVTPPSSRRPATPAFLVPAARAVSAATLSDRACDADSDVGGGDVVRARALHIGGGGNPARRPASAPPPSPSTTAPSHVVVDDGKTATPPPPPQATEKSQQQQQHGQQQQRQRVPGTRERPPAAAAVPHRPSSMAVPAAHAKQHEHVRWRRNVSSFGHVGDGSGRPGTRGSPTSQLPEAAPTAAHGPRGRAARPTASAATTVWLVLLSCITACVVLALASTAVVWRLRAMVGRLEDAAAAVLGAVPVASDDGGGRRVANGGLGLEGSGLGVAL
ncbi:Protein Aster-B [Cladochytrium tenue]|nr:Protein Aster-B [Cladochytrium tenue]